MDIESAELSEERLYQAIQARMDWIDSDHVSAVRLFNGFYEGFPELVVDLYARSLVLYSYANSFEVAKRSLGRAQSASLERLPFVDCVIQKIRSAPEMHLRRGEITFGTSPARQIREHGVWYAIDLLMNQDASFYLDTRLLRKWLLEQALGWKTLNLFAYTGSLGIAALAGGASHVVQVDRNRKFLGLANRTMALNNLPSEKMELKPGDFFSQVAFYKRGELFDCAIVDPPFFSSTDKGTIDLVGQSNRVINKIRPLITDGGRLVVINNALFLSGVDFLHSVERLCKDGYLSISSFIPAPSDITGYPQTLVSPAPRDPSPFNHPTKIIVLEVRRKEQPSPGY